MNIDIQEIPIDGKVIKYAIQLVKEGDLIDTVILFSDNTRLMVPTPDSMTTELIQNESNDFDELVTTYPNDVIVVEIPIVGKSVIGAYEDIEPVHGEHCYVYLTFADESSSVIQIWGDIDPNQTYMIMNAKEWEDFSSRLLNICMTELIGNSKENYVVTLNDESEFEVTFRGSEGNMQYCSIRNIVEGDFLKILRNVDKEKVIKNIIESEINFLPY